MNKIEAFIRPERLDNVKDALANEGILGLTVIQVTGRGVQRGVRTGGRGTQSYMASMLHQLKVEVVVSDADTQKTIDAIVANARTGNTDDGKIFITPVSGAIRIRTGETGDQVL
jgi:nitrogen regulatory protein P-II 1